MSSLAWRCDQEQSVRQRPQLLHGNRLMHSSAPLHDTAGSCCCMPCVNSTECIKRGLGAAGAAEALYGCCWPPSCPFRAMAPWPSASAQVGLHGYTRRSAAALPRKRLLCRRCLSRLPPDAHCPPVACPPCRLPRPSCATWYRDAVSPRSIVERLHRAAGGAAAGAARGSPALPAAAARPNRGGWRPAGCGRRCRQPALPVPGRSAGGAAPHGWVAPWGRRLRCLWRALQATHALLWHAIAQAPPLPELQHSCLNPPPIHPCTAGTASPVTALGSYRFGQNTTVLLTGHASSELRLHTLLVLPGTQRRGGSSWEDAAADGLLPSISLLEAFQPEAVLCSTPGAATCGSESGSSGGSGSSNGSPGACAASPGCAPITSIHSLARGGLAAATVVVADGLGRLAVLKHGGPTGLGGKLAPLHSCCCHCCSWLFACNLLGC